MTGYELQRKTGRGWQNLINDDRAPSDLAAARRAARHWTRCTIRVRPNYSNLPWRVFRFNAKTQKENRP